MPGRARGPRSLVSICFAVTVATAGAVTTASSLASFAEAVGIDGSSLAELLASESDDFDRACQAALPGHSADESIESLQKCISALQRYAEEAGEQRRRSLAADKQYAVDVSATAGMLRQLQSQGDASRHLFGSFRREEQQEAQGHLQSLGGTPSPAAAEAAGVVSAARGLQLLRSQRLQQQLRQLQQVQARQRRQVEPQQEKRTASEPQSQLELPQKHSPLGRRQLRVGQGMAKGADERPETSASSGEGLPGDEQVPVEVGRGEDLADGTHSGVGFAVMEEARCRRPQRSALTAEGSDVATSPSPEAWREFRAQLISGGLKLTTDEEEEEGQQQQEEAVEVPAGLASARVPVAKQNEELLRSQNEALWNEYINGAWAHPSLVEPGGLLVRRPLCAQIVRQMRKGESSFWGDLLRKRLDRELPEPAEGRSREELFQSWSQNTNYCYRLAEKVIDEAMDSLKERLSRAGPDSLRQEDMALVSSLQGEQNQWQAVCLVLSVPAGSMNKAAEAVTINRPIARGMDEVLAQLLLNGENPSVPQHDEETVKRCAKAFGSEAGIYVGGPEQQRQPGLLVHGFEGLPGSTELAPGTRIYKGGARAAIDGVLAGKFSPLDFRWFLGRHRSLSTAGGEWFGVACARPIALKQCLGLPKPLWHEVMELCGGESATFSRLELTKRQDLDEEVREENSEDP